MQSAKTYQNWQWEIDHDQILWLTLDRQGSGVNSLNRAVFKEFNEILDDFSQVPITALIILSGKKTGFIAGADIEQFLTIKNEDEAFDLVRQAQLVFSKLADLKIPTIAVIEGFCLGGGLELALACRYRIAEEGPKTQIGAPEVKLGLIPGWGGTVRLPRLVGVKEAMKLNLSGQPINAKIAAKIGLVDVAVPKRQLLRAARYYALNKPPQHKPGKLDAALNCKYVRPLVAKTLRRELAKKVNKEHYPAPYTIVDNWEKFGTGPDAMENEARSISRLLLTPTSKNLVRVFFLQTRLKGIGKNVQFNPKHIHVVGAGTMGGGIAAWCALRGFKVTLQDRAPDYIAPAIHGAHELFKKKFKIPRLIQAAMDRLTPDPQGLGIREADVIVEAVPEKLEIKEEVYRSIDAKLKPEALLATNTSSLPLSELGKALKQPEDLVGIHFFNPVAAMQLVEVVRGDNSNPKKVDEALAFVRKIDKLPLPVKSKPGFLVNRILMPYLMEAMTMLEEGIPPKIIDDAAVKFGMPVGPVELADMVGLDVCLSVAKIFTEYYGGTIAPMLVEKVEKLELGRKTGKGFYTYQKGKAIKPAVSSTASYDMRDITDRLILRMLNESAACLREGIVEDADLLDAGMIFGTGFAPFRGGPIHYAKQIGVENVYSRLQEFAQKYGERFTPDVGWESLKSAQSASEKTAEAPADKA